MKFPFHDVLYYFYEIFDLVEEAEHFQDRVKILQHYNSTQLRQFLRLQFDPDIEFVEIEEPISYRIFESSQIRGRAIREEIDSLAMFLRYRGNDLVEMTPEKRKKVFIQLLESLDAREVELLMKVKSKSLETEKLTRDLIDAAFPGMLDS